MAVGFVVRGGRHEAGGAAREPGASCLLIALRGDKTLSTVFVAYLSPDCSRLVKCVHSSTSQSLTDHGLCATHCAGSHRYRSTASVHPGRVLATRDRDKWQVGRRGVSSQQVL